ncbi:glycogen debranching protein [Rhodocytophaga rosea]|uniref:Glycogen debranching protein n=1 Tax=Rhodocytophaga rosea TaxID=2704465 RepID=A0A6C0GPQ1_9BACT|nr:discoidin domain-containing protein [Rhodocytophaga rosea]QHT70029.1 glycogen debranching protein [Rhodocytophaga rosea]
MIRQTNYHLILKQLLLSVFSFFIISCNTTHPYTLPDHNKLATAYYQEDRQWYLDNIPFFECSDKQIEQTYYYRWKLYKAHIRNVGDSRYVITEFINHMPWDREPFCTINAASMHHIYEGRWLKDNRYMDGYTNYLFQDGGNDRKYSESVADAAYARYLVNADATFVTKHLDSMKYSYEHWNDHWDSTKNLYYIPAMPDATEYTIASIDASGGKDGFEGGEAFRPTINSYMYGNAMAISHIAALKGDKSVSNDYLQKAVALKNTIEKSLWNDSLGHFTDRFKVNNQYVRYWDFIRGRELAGMAPWYFSLPADTKKFNAAWKHVIDTTYLLGKYGLRTNEPAYEYYFKQFVYFEGQRGSQWNGPSWPYQTSQVITAMANLLNHYKQDVVTNTDYLHLLRQYTKQHFLPNGNLNLVENYDPNLGGPIVYYYWSNHYNHSSYNNLIISGLCGLRPSTGDTLEINPLIDESIDYFYLSDIRYHGHTLTLIYDKDGNRYKAGKGLTVFIDNKKADVTHSQGTYKVFVGAPVLIPPVKQASNVALNVHRKGYPLPTASVNALADTSIYQAIDGKIWYFPEITNRWTTVGSTSHTDWLAIDFGKPFEISSAKIYPFADGNTFAAPDDFTIEYQKGEQWIPVKLTPDKPVKLIGNTGNTIGFKKITATAMRITFKHELKQVAISEIEYY